MHETGTLGFINLDIEVLPIKERVAWFKIGCGWGNTPGTRYEPHTSPKRKRGFALHSLALRACRSELLPAVEPCRKSRESPPRRIEGSLGSVKASRKANPGGLEPLTRP